MNFIKELNFIKVKLMFAMLLLVHSLSYSQTDLQNSGCGYAVVVVEPGGNNSICIHGWDGTLLTGPGSLSLITCPSSSILNVQLYDGCFTNVPCCPESNTVSVAWSVQLPSGGVISCSAIVTLPGCESCEGLDSDGDGVCDEEDCWPYDASQSYSPGDPCDDGNPMTVNDYYNMDCDCIGNPIWTECIEDSDGDGVCDEDDCWPNDPTQNYSPGDSCDDGNPNTVNDVYNANCICTGSPNNCEVDPDDGCPLTIDILNADCTVTNILPNPDDGCPLTADYFDAENCIIVNEEPEVDDGCEGTLDYFDSYTCEIIHEYLPCDDGDPTTVGDKYNSDCECQGCDPCQLEGERWILLCELLNR